MIGDGPQDTEAFADYHRGLLPRRIAVAVGVIATCAAITVGMIAVGTAATASTTQRASTAPRVSSASVSTLAAIDTAPETIGVDAPVPPPPVATPAATGPASYDIDVTATGYQTELDRCQWVRMDLIPDLPIVGAHTRCGGRVVLAMNTGDEVVLSGQGLDGRYRVGQASDAHAGDLASTATAGMIGSVVLQTCYPGTGGRERLIALIPEG